MTLESVANVFAYASLFCSLSFWLSAILSYVHGAPRINLPGPWWLAVIGTAVLLAGAAAVGRSKVWFLAMPLALGTFVFVMYVMGS